MMECFTDAYMRHSDSMSFNSFWHEQNGEHIAGGIDIFINYIGNSTVCLKLIEALHK